MSLLILMLNAGLEWFVPPLDLRWRDLIILLLDISVSLVFAVIVFRFFMSRPRITLITFLFSTNIINT